MCSVSISNYSIPVGNYNNTIYSCYTLTLLPYSLVDVAFSLPLWWSESYFLKGVPGTRQGYVTDIYFIRGGIIHEHGITAQHLVLS